jgi:hypothetical protein
MNMVGISRGGVFAPKEQQNLAQGFNPGLAFPKTAALKVAADQGAFTNTVGNLLGGSYQIWRPFGAHPEKMHNPGLKPWAMIYCPFGASNES